MSKKNNKMMNKIIKYSIIATMGIGILILIIVAINYKTIELGFNEYWIPYSKTTIVDKDSNYYIYEPGTKIYNFSSNGECEVKVVGKKYTEEVEDIYHGKYLYNNLLMPFKPKGAWISETSKSCTYKKTKDSIVMTVDTEDEKYTQIATYKFIDKNTILITWANSQVSNEVYAKIEFKEYVEPFYYYLGKVPDYDVYQRTKKKIKVDELTSMMITDKDVIYFSDTMLVNYIKEKYNMDFEEADFIYLNKKNSYGYIYGGYSGIYTAYNITDDGYLDLFIPVKKRSIKEITKRQEAYYKKTYPGKKNEIKIKAISYNAYACYVKFDMIKYEDQFSEFLSEGFPAAGSDVY